MKGIVLLFLWLFGQILGEQCARAWADQDINKDVVGIEGRPFNKQEMHYIYERTKALIKVNEGVKYTAYNLCKKHNGKVKKVFDKKANKLVDDCEYQNINGVRQYKKIVKKQSKKTIIEYEPLKLYTVCYGNTMIFDKKGKFVRFIQKGERFTEKQCDDMFIWQFEKYKVETYKNMTDKNKINYFNKMLLDEVVVMIDIHWHNGKYGARRTSWAMINFVKYRTRAGWNRLVGSINNDLKHSKQYNDFKSRRQRSIKLLMG